MNATHTPCQLILASSSPYRKDLLSKLGLPFQAVSPSIDETPLEYETPIQTCLRLAEEKAAALADRFENHLIIGSDQIALFEQTRLGKPGGHAEAVDQLMAISGKTVEFLTSVCLFDSASGKKLTDVDRTVVRFRKLSRQQLESYAAKDRPYDCAGGFKSESLGIALIENLETGDPHALIGLPLIKLVGLLAKFGVEIF